MDENKDLELKETEGQDGLTSTPENSEPVPELNNTPTPAPADDNVINNDNNIAPVEEKMFTQDEVNNLMGQVRAETRDRTFNYIYGRYGVQNEDELDSLVGNSQRYDTLKENTDAERLSWEEERKGYIADHDNTQKELCDLKEHLALLESGIDKDRYDDAKFILKGKGLEITAETIADELATHPEWKKSEEKKTYVPENPQPQPQIKVPNNLGNETGKAPQIDEEEMAMEKYFNLK